MHLTPKNALLLTLPPLFWAGNAVVGRAMVGTVAPLTLNCLRWLLAGLILLPLGWRVLRPGSALWRRWRRFSMLGLLGVGSYNALQYLALQTSTPINVTLIAGSMPIWMLVIGALIYKVRPQRRQIGGALLSLAGVVMVMARGSWAVLMQLKLVPGDLYMILAVMLWALYSWMLARPSDASAREWRWAEFLLAQIAYGSLWAVAAAGLEVSVRPAGLAWTPPLVAALFYLAICPSLIAYRCWGMGVAAVGPAIAAFFSNLAPLFAAVLSAALLGDAPRWYHGVAFALILGGIVVSSRR